MKTRLRRDVPKGRFGGTQVIIAAALALLVSVFLGVTIGAVRVSVAEVLGILARDILGIGVGPSHVFREPEGLKASIILQIRLPRVVLSGLVGASLAVAGATFQGIFRNPMADPFVIGVSSGASLGAVLAIVLGLQAGFLGLGAVPLMAFTGALGSILLVYSISRVQGRLPVLTMLLAGIAVGSFLSALVSLAVYFSNQQIHQVVFWLMGGFSGATWQYVRLAVPYVAVGCAACLVYARDLNAMVLGEDTAVHLGVDTEWVKRALLGAASLLTATAVATSGLIGFVGLIVPHVIRLVAGPDHRVLIPASALAGAAFLVTADAMARTVIAPTELPVGILTSMFGGPFFIYLLRRRKNLAYFGSPGGE
ncbi:MAG: iron chelate uptake ABC transporter family permease subunit [Bacillota bacterium]|jgi:iron complex transport system permease protein